MGKSIRDIPSELQKTVESVREKDSEDSLSTLHEALALATTNNERLLEYQIHQKLAKVYEATGNIPCAYDHFRQYIIIKDEIEEQLKHQAIAEIQMLFDVEKAEKEKEIHRLKNIELAQTLTDVQSLHHHLYQLSNEKNDLLSLVAHDLKNPIAIILIIGRTLRENANVLVQKDIVEYTQDIQRVCTRMLQLIDEMLDVNAFESGQISIHLEQTDIALLVRTVVLEHQILAQAKNIVLHSELVEPLTAYTDRRIVLEALANLVSNALKYSPLQSHVYVRSYQNGQEIWIEVRDEGPGISKEEQKKLFTKFTKLSTRPTAGESSTGLGLALVKKMIDAVGGRIWCESELGQGAIFIVAFPAEITLSVKKDLIAI